MEARLLQLESLIASGYGPSAPPVTQQTTAPDGGRTLLLNVKSFVGSGFVCMITFVYSRHVAQCFGLDMILSYYLLTMFVLSFAGNATHAMQSLLGREHSGDESQ